MSAVFKEITLGWGGEEYRITPDMRLLNRIEQDVSLSEMAWRISKGKPPMTHLAFVVGELLRKAGAKAADDEVYQMLMTGDQDQVQEIAVSVMSGVFPQQKKAEAPEAKSKPKK